MVSPAPILAICCEGDQGLSVRDPFPSPTLRHNDTDREEGVEERERERERERGGGGGGGGGEAAAAVRLTIVIVYESGSVFDSSLCG